MARENSSSLESYKDGICSATSSREMISVRTCYCKEKEDVSRKKDDDITNRNLYPSTAISKRLIIKNKACRSIRESPKRERSDEKMPKNRSVEVQSNPVLSPETSTALENAEKIINNAKIQLMEICAMSSLDSARQNQNTYLDPPLDDETEEMLYIRELVASKFYEASTSRSEANDRRSAHLEDRSPQVTVRRVDLSAPKFRMSRRRQRADCRSLEYRSDDRLHERVLPAETFSRNDSSSSKDLDNDVENEATTRDDRTHNLPGRTSSATEGELVRARENTCKIQIGPSVHIVDRELTRQDLEDVHISPETSYSHANTATYILRHFDAAESPVTSADNEPRKIPEAPRKTLRVRLDTSQHEGSIIAEAAIEATSVCVTTNVSENDIKDSEQDDERNEALMSQVQNCIDGEEKEESETKVVECLKNTTNQEAINSVVIENSRTDDEILQEKSKSKVKITFRNDMDYTKKGKIFNNNNDVDEQVHLRDEENVVDEIQEENPSDRSKLLPDNDTSKKIDFPRRGNIASQTYRAMKSSRPYQTLIDERFSNTFDSHNGQSKLYNVTGKDVHHRSFISNGMDDSQIKDNLDEIDLYRPCLNDLDTILISNDKKIERVVRAVENFAEFLSRLEFTTHRDKEKQTPRYVNHGEFHHDLSADKDRKLLNEPTRPLTFETELKNTDLTVSCVPKMHGTNANSQDTSTDTTEIKSSSFTKENGSPSKYSKNSVESSIFPASDSSDGSEISRDKVQRPKTKAYLSESSIYKSDITTFSNIVPALSSTRTETQTSKEKHITQDNHHANAKRHVTSQSHVNRVSKREIDRSQKEYFAKIVAQTPQKDTSEAADRFIAYLLQDEKRSIERKVADALKESTIAPLAVEKLLDNLRNVESIRKARETETLDILKNILINIQNQTDREAKGSVHFMTHSESIQHSKNNSKKDTCQTGNVDDAKISGKKSNEIYEEIKDVKTFPGNVADSSIRTNAIEESVLQTEVKDNANDIGQIAKKSHDFKKSELSSDSSACREKREDAAPLRSMVLLESAQNSKNDSKGNSFSEAESLKQISDIHDDDDILHRKNSQNSSRTISAKFNEGCTLEADDPPIAVSAENKENDVNDKRRGDESNDMEDKNISQEAVKEIIIETHDITSMNQNVSPAKISEIKDDGIHLDANSPESIAEVMEVEDVSFVHSSMKEDIKSLCATKKDVDSQDSVVKEEVGLVTNSWLDNSLQDYASLSSVKSSKLSLKEAASHIKQSIIEDNDLVKDTKDDETQNKSMTIVAVNNHRDENEDSGYLKNTKSNNEEQFASLSSAKKLSLKQVTSHIEQSIIAREDDLIKDTKEDETCGKSMTIDNRRDEIEDSRFLKSTTSNNEEQLIDDDLQKCRTDILSSSNSCVSTSLDYDNRSTNDALAIGNLENAKKIETSSETSHSEGELYMPSSCSYSLGEVRVLKKSELISSNSTDCGSSATIFVTRSMLTSLNDSPMS